MIAYRFTDNPKNIAEASILFLGRKTKIFVSAQFLRPKRVLELDENLDTNLRLNNIIAFLLEGELNEIFHRFHQQKNRKISTKS